MMSPKSTATFTERSSKDPASISALISQMGKFLPMLFPDWRHFFEII
jgi:hypothetical protein